jgi:hypothetical protein
MSEADLRRLETLANDPQRWMSAHDLNQQFSDLPFSASSSLSKFRKMGLAEQNGTSTATGLRCSFNSASRAEYRITKNGLNFIKTVKQTKNNGH